MARLKLKELRENAGIARQAILDEMAQQGDRLSITSFYRIEKEQQILDIMRANRIVNIMRKMGVDISLDDLIEDGMLATPATVSTGY